MLGIVAPPHGDTLRNAIASASRARPCGVFCAVWPAAMRALAVATESGPAGGLSMKFVSWMFCPAASSWLSAYSPSS